MSIPLLSTFWRFAQEPTAGSSNQGAKKSGQTDSKQGVSSHILGYKLHKHTKLQRFDQQPSSLIFSACIQRRSQSLTEFPQMKVNPISSPRTQLFTRTGSWMAWHALNVNSKGSCFFLHLSSLWPRRDTFSAQLNQTKPLENSQTKCSYSIYSVAFMLSKCL